MFGKILKKKKKLLFHSRVFGKNTIKSLLEGHFPLISKKKMILTRQKVCSFQPLSYITIPTLLKSLNMDHLKNKKKEASKHNLNY